MATCSLPVIKQDQGQLGSGAYLQAYGQYEAGANRGITDMVHSPALYELRLELARQLASPNGNQDFGYTLVLPLNKNGYLDIASWSADPSIGRVTRFRPDTADIVGKPHRASPGSWQFDFSPNLIDERPGYRFETEHFGVGEFISIEVEGDHLDFRVVSSRPLHARIERRSRWRAKPKKHKNTPKLRCA